MHSSSVLHNDTWNWRNSFYSDATDILLRRSNAGPTPWFSQVSYSRGEKFFLEGDLAGGVYLLRSGQAKESLLSNNGKAAIVRLLTPGSILGLASVLNGEEYQSTVEALEPCHADYLNKVDFTHLLSHSAGIGAMVIRQLSHDCKQSYSAIRYLGAAGSTAARLAALLLQWASENPLPTLVRANGKAKTAKGVSFRVTLTQEEIGQIVGSTRETTARFLSEFRQKKWITTEGSVWTITNSGGLRSLAEL